MALAYRILLVNVALKTDTRKDTKLQGKGIYDL